MKKKLTYSYYSGNTVVTSKVNRRQVKPYAGILKPIVDLVADVAAAFGGDHVKVRRSVSLKNYRFWLIKETIELTGCEERLDPAIRKKLLTRAKLSLEDYRYKVQASVTHTPASKKGTWTYTIVIKSLSRVQLTQRKK